MLKSEYREPVIVPELKEFSLRYPQYRGLAEGDLAYLYQLLVSPESYVKARVATELELPAVAGVAADCAAAVKAHGESLKPLVKQFIGAVVCCSMEVNGFEKTSTKRAIPHPAFTKGEFYRRKVHKALSAEEYPVLAKVWDNADDDVFDRL